jgi:hypothetical protein
MTDTLADQLFAKRAEYRALGEQVQEALLAALGLDPQTFERIDYDDITRSWIIYEAEPGWEPTQAQAEATFALGFRGGTIWYRGENVAWCCEPTTTEGQ